MGVLDAKTGNEEEEDRDGESKFGNKPGKGDDNHQTAEDDEMYEAMPEEFPKMLKLLKTSLTRLLWKNQNWNACHARRHQ